MHQNTQIIVNAYKMNRIEMIIGSKKKIKI